MTGMDAIDYATAFTVAALGVAALFFGFAALYSAICDARENP